jgi:CheY-like chemotaxis protein
MSIIMVCAMLAGWSVEVPRTEASRVNIMERNWCTVSSDYYHSITKSSWMIKHILLLDDEPSVLRALQLLMQAVGYAVKAYTDSAEALRYLQSAEPCELFITDLRMPGPDGLAVLKQARELRRSLPVVIMSAHADNTDREKALALGCAGFLSKPFTPDDLQRLVLNVQLGAAIG